MTRPLLGLAVLAAALAGPIHPALAQDASVEVTEVITTRYPLVTMVVELRSVDEVDPARLEVTADGRPVEDLQVESIGEAAVEVGIVLAVDTSGSMQGEPIEAARSAALSFVDQMRPQDRVAVVEFNDRARVLAPFTDSREVLRAAIEGLEAAEGTALYDGVVLSSGLFAQETEDLERNLILLSDGSDTTSDSSLREALAAVGDRGVNVYAVALTSPDFDPGPVRRLAEAGDGLFLETSDPAEVEGLYGQIQRELNNRLVVRFTATQYEAGDLQIGLTYGELTGSVAAQVPGFATTLSASEASFPEPQVTRVVSRAPVDLTSLFWLAVACVALTVSLIVFILAGPKRDEGERMRDRLAAYGKDRQAREKPAGLLARIPLLSRFSDQAEKVAKRRGFLRTLNTALEQADIPLRPGEAIVGAFGLSIVAALLAGLMTASLIFGLVAFGVGLLFMAAAIQWIGRREKRRFESQLPDTLILLSTSLRAGYSLLQAVEAVAEEAPSPTAREFARAIAESRLGRPVVAAMKAIAERMQSDDFAWAVMAIEIQREVGGNLAEVLQIVADTMQARNRLRGDIKAMTAEGRISAIVLGIMPFALFGFLWTSNRDYLDPLLSRTVGWVAIIAGLVLMAGGMVWMKKIVDIEV